jgi:phage shock protein PspC (stress-responsive transcriptional regulator)
MDSDQTPPGEEPTQPQEPQPEEPQPRRLTRPREGRVVSGVCAGLGRYFGVDPVLFRVAAVALIFFGGAGVLLYIAAVLLVPEEGEDTPAHKTRRDRALAIVGVILLVVAAGTVFSHGFHAGWVVGPFAFVLIAGLVAWWLVSGERPRGDGRDIARSVARGVGVLAICVALAFGGAWLAGTGGGTAAAIAVIVAGAALAGAALEGHGRWLILPALSLALPVAFVSAANIDLHGGAGDKQYNPTSASEVRDSYRVGAGRLIVDLRNAQLPPGDRALKVKVGVGEAVLIVPRDVCVATEAKIGMGQVQSFDRSNSGVDVNWSDQPPAPAGTTRVVLDANVGIGRVAVSHTYDQAINHHGPVFHDPLADQTNTGCTTAHAAG